MPRATMPRPVDSVRFAELVEKELDAGFGFVPLLGSGISAPAGIPTGPETSAYLFHCLRRALAPDGEERADFRYDPWPDLGEGSSAQGHVDASEWSALARRIWDNLPSDVWPPDVPGRGTSAHSRMTPIQKTWTAVLADLCAKGPATRWMHLLYLVAHIRSRGNRLSIASTPDRRVIDSFFTHITSGKLPSVGHTMLAHLADKLRVHTVLTTNFDALVEAAFAGLRMSLSSFHVHVDAGLPSAALVLRSPSIVKLHGHGYGLRDGLQVDEEPSGAEMEEFARYVVPPPALFLVHPTEA